MTRKISRRGFIKGASALAAAGLIPVDYAYGSAAWKHRIVRAHHPLASCFDVLDYEFQQKVPDTYYGNFVSQRVVNEMFDAALCAFTGDRDPAVALRKLIPYQSGERVFIKINNTTSYALWGGDWDKIKWDLHWNDMDAIAEPINATIRALVRIGVPQEMIGIGDASWSEGDPNSERRTPRLTPNRLALRIKTLYPGVILYRSSFMPDGNGISWTSNDSHAIVEFRDPIIDRRKQRVTSHRLPDQLIRADHFINLPIMKRHDSGGVTGALKNNFGTIASCAYFHAPRYTGGGPPGAMANANANPAVDIWLNPHVGAKTRLIVCDGILAGWNWGGDPPLGWKNFGGRSPNCLLLGTDPVAMDSVVYDQVTESLADKVKAFPAPNMLIDAAKVGLGCHESRPNPQASYRTIDYQEIDLKYDPAKLQQLAKLKTRYKAGSKSAAEVRAILDECWAVLA